MKETNEIIQPLINKSMDRAKAKKANDGAEMKHLDDYVAPEWVRKEQAEKKKKKPTKFKKALKKIKDKVVGKKDGKEKLSKSSKK